MHSRDSNSFSKWTNINQISPLLICAIVKAEDRTFFRHHGFDLPAILRALKQNVINNKTFGASTITQQLSKNLFGSSDRTFLNKIYEAWFTLKLEIFFSKIEILEYYLNALELGHNIWGIKVASQHYFNKDPNSLSLVEALIIASLIANPLDIDSSKNLHRIETVFRRVNYQLYSSSLYEKSTLAIANSHFQLIFKNIKDGNKNSNSQFIFLNYQPNNLINFLINECGLKSELENEKKQ